MQWLVKIIPNGFFSGQISRSDVKLRLFALHSLLPRERVRIGRQILANGSSLGN